MMALARPRAGHHVHVLVLAAMTLLALGVLVFVLKGRNVRWRRPQARLGRVSKPIALKGVDNVPVWAVESLVLRDRARRKDLQLRVTYPTEGTNLPVIVFSHGTAGSKDDYQLLIQYWCARGYACIQLNHSDAGPLGGKRGPGIFKDWASRPEDVSLVIASLDLIARAIPSLRARWNTQHIGVGGHSFGAHTAQLLGGLMARDRDGRSISFRNPRVVAVLMLSPQGRGKLHRPDAWSQFELPMMTITGTRDRGRNGEDYTWRLDPFELSPPGDKYLIVIRDADHELGGIPRSSAQFPYASDEELAGIVQEESARFWDAYLKGDEDARRGLHAAQPVHASPERVELRTK